MNSVKKADYFKSYYNKIIKSLNWLQISTMLPLKLLPCRNSEACEIRKILENWPILTSQTRISIPGRALTRLLTAPISHLLPVVDRNVGSKLNRSLTAISLSTRPSLYHLVSQKGSLREK